MFVDDHMVNSFESYIDHGDDHEHKRSHRGHSNNQFDTYSRADRQNYGTEHVDIEWSYEPLSVHNYLRAYQINVKFRVKALTDKAVLFEPVVFFEFRDKKYHFVSNTGMWMQKSVLNVLYTTAPRGWIYHKRLELRSAIETEIVNYAISNDK